MIRVIAVDDEPLALRQLGSYIAKIPYFTLVAPCKSALEASAVLEKEQVDAMFLDINMPDLSGMDFVHSLANPPLVVFTTAYSEYAVEGYKVEAVDYLLKPFSLSDFQAAAAKVKKICDMREAVSDVSMPDADDALFFKTDYKIVRVELGSIIYVEGMSEYLKIHVATRPDPVVVLLSMKKFEERLPSDKFMRVHKSYIINLSCISEVSKNRILLQGDVSVPIGDIYRPAFSAWLDGKFLGK
ncbi:MAG: response regulator transcription factor [Bacteroidales bacterium]|nr:response regulator transcription factor [Bacteroidales bacterium]